MEEAGSYKLPAAVQGSGADPTRTNQLLIGHRGNGRCVNGHWTSDGEEDLFRILPGRGDGAAVLF